MNLTIALSALRARYRLLLLIVAATVVATIVISLLMPKTYIGKTSLLIDERDEQTIRPGNNNGYRMLDRERANYMLTQVEIVSSPRVALRVVDDLKLADNAEKQQKFRNEKVAGSIENWLADNLLKQLKITPSSNILQLNYAADDADHAAQVANAFAKAYMDTMLELRVEPAKENTAWFNEQLKGLRENMEEAQSRLAQFQYDNRIGSNDEQMDVDNIQLSELAKQVARLHEWPEAASRSSGRDGLPATDVRALADIQILRAELTRSESKLHELSVGFGPRHPSYQRQSAEVDSLRTRLMNAAKQAAASSAERSRRHRDQLVGDFDSQRERILKQREARSRISVLSNNATVAQRVYEAAMQSFLTFSIDSRARQTSVRVLNPATPPFLPKSPKILLNIAISVVIGLLLGLATIYLLELIDQRVRQLEDLAWDPNIPILGVLRPWNTEIPKLSGYSGSRYALPAPGAGETS